MSKHALAQVCPAACDPRALPCLRTCSASVQSTYPCRVRRRQMRPSARSRASLLPILAPLVVLAICKLDMDIYSKKAGQKAILCGLLKVLFCEK